LVFSFTHHLPLREMLANPLVTVVDGVPLRVGSLLAAVSRGADEPLSLSAAQEDVLLASMAENQCGEFITIEQLQAESAAFARTRSPSCRERSGGRLRREAG
jgi:hypothetical protein